MPWIWRIGLHTSDTKEEWRWDRRWWKCDEGDENWFLCVRARVTDVLTKDDLCLKHCLVPITAADNLSFTHNTVTHVHSHEQTHMCTFPISHITASDPLIGSPWLAVLLINGIHGTLHRAQERLDLIGWLLQQETGNKLLHVGSPLIHLERKKKDWQRVSYIIWVVLSKDVTSKCLWSQCFLPLSSCPSHITAQHCSLPVRYYPEETFQLKSYFASSLHSFNGWFASRSGQTADREAKITSKNRLVHCIWRTWQLVMDYWIMNDLRRLYRQLIIWLCGCSVLQLQWKRKGWCHWNFEISVVFHKRPLLCDAILLCVLITVNDIYK